MRTSEIKYTAKGLPYFRYGKRTIYLSELLRFGTPWTSPKDFYRISPGFFESCNRFVINGYYNNFFELSECGEQISFK